MKIRCPRCKRVINMNNINISKDVAMCPPCGHAFSISKLIHTHHDSNFTPYKPPAGAWFSKTHHEVVLGATTRSPTAFFVVPFTLAWVGGSVSMLYGEQTMSSHFNLMAPLFEVPFLIVSIFLVCHALMLVFGKVQINIRKGMGTVFTGVGNLGWIRKFNWNEVDNIYKKTPDVVFFGEREYANSILLEGKRRLFFGSLLSECRISYMLNTLKYLKNEI